MEALCHPPDHPVQLGYLHLRLRTGPPQERRPRTQAVAMCLGHYGPYARCRPCTVCCALPSILPRTRGTPVWTSPGVSGLCCGAVCKTMRAATEDDHGMRV